MSLLMHIYREKCLPGLRLEPQTLVLHASLLSVHHTSQVFILVPLNYYWLNLNIKGKGKSASPTWLTSVNITVAEINRSIMEWKEIRSQFIESIETGFSLLQWDSDRCLTLPFFLTFYNDLICQITIIIFYWVKCYY